MAKQQSFAEKAKGKHKDSKVNVKFVKAVKSPNGGYKFSEKFYKLDDINKVSDLK